MNNRSYQKYLDNRNFRHVIEPLPCRKYKNFVVIPVLDESVFLPKTLQSLANNSIELLADTMILVVVNNSIDSEASKIADNQIVLESFRSKVSGFEQTLNLHWIDASSAGLELDSSGGVGAGRKLGMDMVLDYCLAPVDSLLFCLDADTLVSSNYLEASGKFFTSNRGIGGAVVRFLHSTAGATQDEELAIISYELFMRYYRLALVFSGSPYAYYSLGSAMVCRASTYVRAGGMREKNGGEDFYFMQAMRKITSLGEVNEACVYPSSRASDRVPFGTGPKIRQITTGSSSLKAYNPECFISLKKVFSAILNATLDDLTKIEEVLYPEFPVEFREFLEMHSFCKSWRKIVINTPRSVQKLREAFHIWFDAFRTLKYLHFCEQEYQDRFGRISFCEAFWELWQGFFACKLSTCTERELLDKVRKMENDGSLLSFIELKKVL